MGMIHTYQHRFQNGVCITVLVNDDDKCFKNLPIKCSMHPPSKKKDPWFTNEYRAWWTIICMDFHQRTDRMVPNPVADPKWKGF